MILDIGPDLYALLRLLILVCGGIALVRGLLELVTVLRRKERL